MFCKKLKWNKDENEGNTISCYVFLLAFEEPTVTADSKLMWRRGTVVPNFLSRIEMKEIEVLVKLEDELHKISSSQA